MLKAFDRDYFVALLLLLPGFLTWQVMIYFGGKLEGGDFHAVAFSLAFSLVNFVLALSFWRVIGRLKKTFGILGDDANKISAGFIGVLVTVSIFIGIGGAWVDRSGILYRAAAPTTRISQTRPWITMWEKCRPAWAKVTLSNGKTYLGYVVYFSDTNANTELVLNRVYSIDESGKRSKLKAERLLLFGKDITGVEVFPASNSRHCSDEEDY